MAQVNFNAATVNPQQSFDPIPANWYNVQIVKSEVGPTKAGTGTILKLQLVVLDGEFAKRVVWCNLNIMNPNQQAQEISQGQLSAICHATGVMQLGDSQELHMKPFQVKVTVRPAQGQWDASNDCKAFKAIEGASNGMQPPAQAPQQQQQAPPQQQAPTGPPQGQQQPWAAPQQPAGQQPPAQAQQPVYQQPAQQPAPQGQVGQTDAPPWTQ